MYPEDRVLVAVIKTKRDLKFAQDAHWYRIPQGKMSRGVNDEYLAFFLSGKVFGEQSSTIAYYARRKGVELAYRRDLIPAQANHPRANDVYYRVELDTLQIKSPPITNPQNRVISFIQTTWDRFVSAREIADLYSTADHFVDRIYHALKSPKMRIERFWEAERGTTGYAPQLRILCQKGEVIASTDENDGTIYLDGSKTDDEILELIKAQIANNDGPVMLPILPDT